MGTLRILLGRGTSALRDVSSLQNISWVFQLHKEARCDRRVLTRQRRHPRKTERPRKGKLQWQTDACFVFVQRR